MPRPPTRTITRAEMRVLAGIARGRSYPEIAEQLGVAATTVRTYADQMRRRHAVATRAAMVRLAYERGWLAGLAPEPRPQLHLSRRQQDALQGIADGLTRRQLARRLDITEATVGAHMRRLFDVIGAHSQAHALALAYQHGLLRLERTAAVA